MCSIWKKLSESRLYVCLGTRSLIGDRFGFAPYEDLDLYKNFEVHRIRNLIQEIFIEGSVASGYVPDHFFLTWVYKLPDEISHGENASNGFSSYVKYT